MIQRHFDDELINNRHIGLTILKEFGFGKFAMMEKRILREVDELSDIFEANQGRAFDPWQPISIGVSNVISSMVFNQR